eukprot:1156850-Pelagomonas_calceolata.AAC.13
MMERKHTHTHTRTNKHAHVHVQTHPHLPVTALPGARAPHPRWSAWGPPRLHHQTPPPPAHACVGWPPGLACVKWATGLRHCITTAGGIRHGFQPQSE